MMFLKGAGQETGNILEGDDRNVERVTKTYKACAFFAGVDIQYARENSRLIRHDPNGVTTKSCKTNDDILCIILMDLEELPTIHDHADGILDIIGFVRVVWHQRIESFIHAQRIIRLYEGCVFHVVLRQ